MKTNQSSQPSDDEIRRLLLEENWSINDTWPIGEDSKTVSIMDRHGLSERETLIIMNKFTGNVNDL